eukprot:augustus_masked-scaffold_2-processed-gene-15.34-mRNA-1 protein AED:1.00 eAED:1.00 QI:0/-1/0/0/-1/1/1/0/359
MQSKSSAPSERGESKRHYKIKREADSTRGHIKSLQHRRIITGIGQWEEHIDDKTGHIFFFNPEDNTNSWGLPLRYILPEDERRDDDWEVHIQSGTFRRFYESKQEGVKTFKPPRTYAALLKTLPYFSKEFSENTKKARKYVTAFKSKELAATASRKIKLSDVLNDPIACAGFHKYLLATRAEENLLFFIACEIYKEGTFHGQRILGEKMVGTIKGQEILYEQMKKSRASLRVGLTARILKDSKLTQVKILYDRFIKDGSALWIFIPYEIRTEIEATINRYESLPLAQQNSSDLLSIFDDAKMHVYDSMMDELFPGFLTSVIERTDIDGFKSDEVLRITLLQFVLQESDPKRQTLDFSQY